MSSGSGSAARRLAWLACAWALLRPDAGNARDLRVAPDGSGDFARIQDAIDAVPDGGAEWVVIRIAPGTYFEQLVLPASKSRITLLGAGPERTTVNWDRSAWDSQGRWVAEPVVVCAADDVRIRSLAIHNLADEPGGSGGQWDAAILTRADRIALSDVWLRGDHDTLLAYGPHQRVFVDDSWIRGRGDFVASFTTVYIRSSLLERTRDRGHFLYQHSDLSLTPAQRDRLVVADSVFRGVTRDAVWPFGLTNLNDHAIVYLLRNRLEDAIGTNRPPVHFHSQVQTWDAWVFHQGNVATAGSLDWSRYSYTGPVGTPLVVLPVHDNAAGEPFVQALAVDEAAALTPQAVLGGSDGWDPEAASAPTPVWLGGDGSWQDPEAWTHGESPDVVRDAVIADGRVSVAGHEAQAVDVVVGPPGSGASQLSIAAGSLASRHVEIARGGTLAVEQGGVLRARFLRIHLGSLGLVQGQLDLEERLVVAPGSSLWLLPGASLRVPQLTSKGDWQQRGGGVEVALLFDVNQGSYRLAGGSLDVAGLGRVGTAPGAPAWLRVEGGVARFRGELSLGHGAGREGGLALSGGRVEVGGPLRVGHAGGAARLELLGGRGALSAASYVQGASGVLVARIEREGVAELEVGGDVHFDPDAETELRVAPGAPPGWYTLMRWSGRRTGTLELAAGSSDRIEAVSLDSGQLRVLVGASQVPALPLLASIVAGLALVAAARRRIGRRGEG